MKTYVRLIIIGMLIPLVLSCEKENKPEDEIFELGPTEKYTVEESDNFSIDDPVSGCTFIFPKGGSGTLTVTGIIDGPELEGILAERFMLDFDGTGEIELLVPIENLHVQAFVYGPITGASVKPNIGENSWGVMIEQDTVDGSLRFLLNPGELNKSTKSAISKYTPPESKYFAVSRISKESENWDNLVAFYQSIKQVADIWLGSLTTEEAAPLRELMNGNMKFDVRISSSNYYQHFNNWVWGKNAIFYLKPGTGLSGIAHETGHYMNHLLCGYDRYHQIYGDIPKEYWGLGGSVDHLFGMIIEGRSYLLEEYAYFSEFLAIGTVEMHDLYNVENVNYFSQAVAADPSKNDYPSYEGFGSAMLASLMRTDNMIHTYDIRNKSKVKVPVIGAPLGGIIRNVIAKGPRNVNELFSQIVTYLAGMGQDELSKWPAMIQPLGWSYYGKGILVDKEDKAVTGAKVRPVIIAGEEYHGQLSEGTTGSGEFNVRGLPPGRSVLRVYANMENNEYKDSADLEITVDYLGKTSDEVDLGKLVVEFTDQLETKVISKLYNTRIYKPSASLNGPVINSQLDFNVQYTVSTRNFDYHGASSLENTDYSSLVKLQIDCHTNSPVTADFILKWTLSDYSWTWEYNEPTNYLSQVYQLSSSPAITEEDYREGPYAPEFTWNQELDGSVGASLAFYPDSLFKDVNFRRYRLNARFEGTYELYNTNGSKNTYSASFGPSSVVIYLNKRY